MTPRVFAPGARPSSSVTLSVEESRHLTGVLRLRPGAVLRVFDGRGGEFAARLDGVARSGATVSVGEPVPAAPEPAIAFTLAAAVLKGDGMDRVVRDATMMGVRKIAPVVCERSQVTVVGLRRRGAAERWRRIALASAKQCGRAVVPDVFDPVTFPAFVSACEVQRRLMLVEPRATVAGRRAGADLAGMPVPGAVVVAAGPEGGWTPEELSLAAAHGFEAITLGSRTLRADALPVVALSALLFAWGDL